MSLGYPLVFLRHPWRPTCSTCELRACLHLESIQPGQRCCVVGGNSWPEVVAAHFSRGYQWASPREAGDITYTLADADTTLRRQTTDPHPGCDASCYPSFGKERVWGRNRGKNRESIWVNRFPQGILILPREACDMNWFYLHTHFIIWMLKVFIRVLYITKLQVLTCLMRNRQMAV